MYNKESLKRRIAKYGLQETIKLLSSDNFPDEVKFQLEKEGIFVGGYLCISALYSL